MLAMAEQEGWHSIGSSKSPKGSITYRHHNPGALRASPYADKIEGNFAVFGNDGMGWFAFYWDLFQKSKGNTSTKLGPDSTLRDLIFTWAPPSDKNDSEKYLEEVVKNSGLTETITLKEIFSN